MDLQGKKKRKTMHPIWSLFTYKEKALTSDSPPILEYVSTSERHSPPSLEHILTNEVNPQVDVGISMHTSPIEENTHNVEINIGCLERDPIKRVPIWQQPVNQMDEIRRAYIKMGPYQPILHKYPASKIGAQNRRFQKSWLKKFNWLEYSDSTDKAFCFPCFLFESKTARYPTFTTTGFDNWKRVNCGSKCPFLIHVGGPNSPHNIVVNSMSSLMNVNRQVDKVLNAQTLAEKKKNRLRLKTTIESIRWLTLQACAFRGHRESVDSSNRGNLIEMIKLMARLNPSIDEVVLEKAPKGAKYTSPDIQKDILHILAKKVKRKIRDEIGDAKFCILVDEARDVSDKEQMAIVLRFVDSNGFVKERFIEIVEVKDTTSATLKEAIVGVLGRHDLHTSNMRGQGYDGASNMSGSWNGLQALFLRDCPYAYYVHCFAHRLQLALVGAAEKEISVWQFFSKLNCIVNLMTASTKRREELHSAQAIEIAEMIATGERGTGRGANQIGNVQRAGKTRWSSHFESICSVVDMYKAVMKVLEKIILECSSISIRGEAAGCLNMMVSFDFVFIMYLMHKIMGITDLLCKALQQKSLDIVNAMNLVSTTKEFLLEFRAGGYEILLTYVKSVCLKLQIEIPDMDAPYKSAITRLCRQDDSVTFEHHYHFDVFHATIDFQFEELSTRFNENSVELLTLSVALEPKNNFSSFNIDHICTLAEKFYPGDFIEQDMHHLRLQIEHYKLDVIRHERFQGITTISELCRRLVETNKSETYNMIDRLIRLVLTLPVSTATTERAFSAMKLVKTALRNKMGEDNLSDSLVVYIERQLAESIDVDSVIDDFYSKKHRIAQI